MAHKSTVVTTDDKFNQSIQKLILLKTQLNDQKELNQEHSFASWLKTFDGVRLPFGFKGQSVMYESHVKQLKLGRIPAWAKFTYCQTGFVLTAWVKSQALKQNKF